MCHNPAKRPLSICVYGNASLHQYMGNLAIFSILCHLNPYGVEWPFGHIHSSFPFRDPALNFPPGHILHHWHPWPILNPTNPKANTLVLGPWGHLDFQGPLAPLNLSTDFGPPPLIRGFGA
ncbi:hypothetical protein O181_051628 [Austropuccinia psidii MF-1]|uniref:Uncharacterized protein n=1 Tax=Austropuccinia psidii MF-1 TaxID=1389203 RepID=A0A9Q3HNJ8_9BASI|nr:hypothetical protein [Austropuccinia psidii MF-1]